MPGSLSSSLRTALALLRHQRALPARGLLTILAVPLNWKQKTRISPWRLIPAQCPHGLHSMILILCLRTGEHTYCRVMETGFREIQRETASSWGDLPPWVPPWGPSFPTSVLFAQAPSPHPASPSLPELDLLLASVLCHSAYYDTRFAPAASQGKRISASRHEGWPLRARRPSPAAAPALGCCKLSPAQPTSSRPAVPWSGGGPLLPGTVRAAGESAAAASWKGLCWDRGGGGGGAPPRGLLAVAMAEKRPLLCRDGHSLHHWEQVKGLGRQRPVQPTWPQASSGVWSQEFTSESVQPLSQ